MSQQPTDNPRGHHGSLPKAALRRLVEIVCLRFPTATTVPGLSKRLPTEYHDPQRTSGFSQDRVIRLDDDAIFVEGWLRDGGPTPASLRSAGGKDLTKSLVRTHRPDVSAYYGDPEEEHHQRRDGFFATIVHPGIGKLPSAMPLIFESAEGCRAVRVADPVDDPNRIESILWDAWLKIDECQWSDEFCRDQVYPALARIYGRHRSKSQTVAATFGPVPSHPTVSMVSIVMGDLSYLEQFMAGLIAASPREVEHTLVMDNGQFEHVRKWVEELSFVFCVPVRIVVPDTTVGLAARANSAASLANGDFLFFTTTEFIPGENAFLESAVEALSQESAVGIVEGPMLTPSKAIIHACEMLASANSASLLTAPRLAGVPLANELLRRSSIVDAVSGKAFCVRKDEFNDVGGFNEKLDGLDGPALSASLAKHGLKSCYIPNASFVQLPASWESIQRRKRGRIYNKWYRSEFRDNTDPAKTP